MIDFKASKSLVFCARDAHQSADGVFIGSENRLDHCTQPTRRGGEVRLERKKLQQNQREFY
jgi:hypothetical protein